MRSLTDSIRKWPSLKTAIKAFRAPAIIAASLWSIPDFTLFPLFLTKKAKLNSDWLSSDAGISTRLGKTCSNCRQVSKPFLVKLQPSLEASIRSAFLSLLIIVRTAPSPTLSFLASLFQPRGFCDNNSSA